MAWIHRGSTSQSANIFIHKQATLVLIRKVFGLLLRSQRICELPSMWQHLHLKPLLGKPHSALWRLNCLSKLLLHCCPIYFMIPSSLPSFLLPVFLFSFLPPYCASFLAKIKGKHSLKKFETVRVTHWYLQFHPKMAILITDCFFKKGGGD